MIGYCVKCRRKREVIRRVMVMMKNDRPAVKGICYVCQTTVFVIVKKDFKLDRHD